MLAFIIFCEDTISPGGLSREAFSFHFPCKFRMYYSYINFKFNSTILYNVYSCLSRETLLPIVFCGKSM